MVEADCSIPGHPEVFVLGDAAHFAHDPAGMLPGVCPVAMQMGTMPRRSFERGGGRPAARPVPLLEQGRAGRDRPRARGGQHPAPPLRRDARVARLDLVHIFFLIGFRNRLLVHDRVGHVVPHLFAGRAPHHRAPGRPAADAGGCFGMTVTPDEIKARAPSSISSPAGSRTRGRPPMAMRWTGGWRTGTPGRCGICTGRRAGGRILRRSCLKPNR